MEMENGVQFATAQSVISQSNRASVPEFPESQNCPVCNSIVRLFYINFNEKLLMCENETCDYPFGYDEVKVYAVDENGQLVFEDDVGTVTSERTKESPTVTGSVISTAAWSEIDKLVRCCEEDDVPPAPMNSDISSEQSIMENQIQKNLDAISELNNQLQFHSEEENKNVTIKKEKWLRSLKTIEEVSGVNLLKPEEVKFLKKEEPNIGLGELRIDIGRATDSEMSSIKIEIHNNNNTESA